MKISPGELTELAGLIHQACGIVLDQKKDYLIESRLQSLLQKHNFTTFGQLTWEAKQSPDLTNTIVDAITTNETSFFRDRKPFDLLKEKILPAWLERQSGTGRLRIWSSASSSGQEAYTILMVLKEFFGSDLGKNRISVTGTDISDTALERARQGRYSHLEIARGIEGGQLRSFFEPFEDGWMVKDELRRLAEFKKQNLLQPFSSLGTFDLIFCRNVAIYFSEENRTQLFERISRQLNPGGVLFIGSTESLFGINTRFERHEENGAAYYTLD